MGAQIAISFVAGLVFACGLALSGMTLPQNIIGFLDLTNWKPALIFVMVGAILVYSIAFHLITRREKPILRDRFEIPTSKVIDAPLVIGALVFGVGWGLGGLCGGPAFAALAVGGREVVAFVIAMFIGTFVAKKLFDPNRS